MTAGAREAFDKVLIGASSEIQKLRLQIERVAPLDLPVMIEGPTGSGKELVAQALHELSGRPGRLVAFNVCALAETMFEDALFGHVRGAFTGAASSTPGLLAEADGGTAFFDEIGSLGLARQATLLRALETRSFRHVGGTVDRWSDFRLISASNVSIPELVAAGRFREDLSYRIRAIVLRVPSLRTRGADIHLLIDRFLEEHEQLTQRTVRFSECARTILGQSDWPGNVRQLRHVVRSAAALATGDTVEESDVRDMLRASCSNAMGEVVPSAQDGADGLKLVLERNGWDTVRAAEELGLSRQTIYKRIRRLGLVIPEKYRRKAGETDAINSNRAGNLTIVREA